MTGSNAIKLDVQNSTGADLVVRAVRVLDGKVTHQDSGTTIANGAKYHVDATAPASIQPSR